MRLFSRIGGAAVIAGAVVSCGVVTGLHEFSSGETTDDASARKAGLDAATDSRGSTQGEAAIQSMQDGSGDEIIGDDAGDDGDAMSSDLPDAGESGSGEDAEGASDGNASTDAGGGCLVTCNQTTGTPSCTGSKCSYTCNSGRRDCNAGTAPDTDGCECAGNACCGTGCQTSHSDGEGQDYYDCTATNTHNQTEAQLACEAYTGGTCAQSTSGGCNCLLVLCGPPSISYCGTVGSSCYCWQYSGPHVGTVQGPSGSGCGASCGSSSDTKWN